MPLAQQLGQLGSPKPSYCDLLSLSVDPFRKEEGGRRRETARARGGGVFSGAGCHMSSTIFQPRQIRGRLLQQRPQRRPQPVVDLGRAFRPGGRLFEAPTTRRKTACWLEQEQQQLGLTPLVVAERSRDREPFGSPSSRARMALPDTHHPHPSPHPQVQWRRRS